MIHITHLLVQFFHLPLQFLTLEIAITIILEHACLLFASKLNPIRERALDRACSQYKSSDIHHKVREQFSAPPIQYSIFQFTEFIIQHRL
jgi:hypothetical protein